MARTELDHHDRQPLYQQLADILRAQIQTGQIPPRRALPSKKTLMQDHGISARTVDSAMDVLRDEGLIETVIGKGLYVTDQR